MNMKACRDAISPCPMYLPLRVVLVAIILPCWSPLVSVFAFSPTAPFVLEIKKMDKIARNVEWKTEQSRTSITLRGFSSEEHDSTAKATNDSSENQDKLNNTSTASEATSSSQLNMEHPDSSNVTAPKEMPRDIRTEDLMAAMGTNPRRIFLSLASGTGIALAGNFLGVTSKLLTLLPESTVEKTGLDTYFPRGEYKRVKGKGYTFVIPKEWVGDTFVELAKAQRRTRSLDLSMDNGRTGGPSTFPDVAFGPPGRLNPRTGVSEQGDTNVSVIKSDGLSNFSLKGTLGTPTNAAETFLRLSLAPEGSGRKATLLQAEEDLQRSVYQFTYDVDRGPAAPPLRAISVIAAGKPEGTILLTLTVIAPKETWEVDTKFAQKMQKIADSFHTI